MCFSYDYELVAKMKWKIKSHEFENKTKHNYLGDLSCWSVHFRAKSDILITWGVFPDGPLLLCWLSQIAEHDSPTSF